MKLWHGGAPNRRVGELLLPPSQTGFKHTSGSTSAGEGLDKISYRADRVYLTTDRDLAAAFAGLWTKQPHLDGKGWLYAVEVEENDLAQDGDLLSSPGLSYHVASARISAIEVYRVLWAPKHMRKMMGVVQQNEARRITNLNQQTVV